MTPMPDSRDYKDTLFLPQTDFPMRAGLPKKEPEHLQRWQKMGLYHLLRQQSDGRKPFVLHDGPPYANGHLHIGHAMNKILKDLVVRSRQMSGYDANYVPGWDCHGLPIEWEVEKEFRSRGRAKSDVPASEFREACRAYARKWVDIQRQEFKRYGIEGDWEDPYLTMKFESEATIVAEFLKLVAKGLVYQGSKPVMWSPVEQTALAEAEIEYRDHQSTTIWVKFPFKTDATPKALLDEGFGDAKIIIWTTTPWTIPGNRAICYGPKMSYGLYRVQALQEDLAFAPWSTPGDLLIVADALAESVREAGLIATWERVRDVPPGLLEGARCAHPLAGFAGGYQFDVPLLAGDHVTEEAGTGFVHTAPGHGQDDYFAWLAHGLPLDDIPYTVGPDGAFTDDAPGFTGEKVIVTEGKKAGRDGGANQAVIKALIECGGLLARGRIKHSYPHSWRSKAPIIFRNTPQWFVRLDGQGEGGQGEGGLRDIALAAIEDTRFVPPGGKNRIRAMVEGRPDWLVSRQRTWGVPIALFADKNGVPLCDEAVNLRIIEAIAERGADAWFDTPAQAFLGDKYDAKDYQKVEDILDVWFDSGSTHAFVLEKRNDLKWPADLYLEGSDQHRGWFQSSLLESCGTRGRAPFETVLTHGFVLDEQGHKMSKSVGNVVDPQDLIRQYGADILRIWVASSDYSDDLRMGKEIIASSVDGYRKLRNSLRYLLGAVSGFDDGERLPVDEMPELERYMLHLVADLDQQIMAAYEAYDFKMVWRRLIEFCSIDLSAFYLDIRKDSLYCDNPSHKTRRAARTVMHEILARLNLWLAPICVFTAEEVWQQRFGVREKDSVHLHCFVETPKNWHDPDLATRWQSIRMVRKVVTGALEVERREKNIGASLEAAPTVYVVDEALLALCQTVDFATLAITSHIHFKTGTPSQAAFTMEEVDGVAVVPTKAEGGKCARCWRILPEVDASHSLCGRCEKAVMAHDHMMAGAS